VLRVAVDAMGGDYAPEEIVKGVITAVKKADDMEFLLVGAEDSIKKCLGSELEHPRIKIINADEVIGSNEEPGLAIRRKKKASMVVAIQLVRSGEADAIITAGNTGALMAGSLLFLGRITGINRPALLAVIPTFEGSGTVVLDVGANMDAKPEHMLQYSIMGKIYAQEVLKKDSPRTALLNVGSEENKGNAQVKSSYELFEKNLDNFVGNLEAKEIFRDTTDVLVCDGFVGNVLLKSIEGISRDLFAYLKEEINRDFLAKIASTMLLSVFNRVRSKLDESEHGGAPLIGIDGICIKCHGSSREKSISQALLKQVYPLVKNKANEKIEAALKE